MAVVVVATASAAAAAPTKWALGNWRSHLREATLLEKASTSAPGWAAAMIVRSCSWGSGLANSVGDSISLLALPFIDNGKRAHWLPPLASPAE